MPKQTIALNSHCQSSLSTSQEPPKAFKVVFSQALASQRPAPNNDYIPGPRSSLNNLIFFQLNMIL